MATTSTEAVSNSTHKTYRLGQNIINRAREKIWNGDIVATASTHGFWEPDKEFKIKVKVDELRRKFHQTRYLQVKHLPRDVSEEEIRQMLSDFPIISVTLSCGHGSAGSAKAYLEDPEMLEDWDKDRTFLLRGQKIPVSPTLTELVLCVARYPLHYSESHFTGLVSSYGEVKMCFLMISEKTGESKGYGFVEYASKETALHAKSNLDGLLINDTTLCVDFLDSTHITFESLHSKCLYVENLPHNYRDMGEFRRKFSKVVSPPYCQIALKNGCPQNWGLVEFNSGEDAENTHIQLNGCELKDKKLKISYYIPGVRAINLYLKLLNETDNNRGKGNGLLPTPPPGVFQSFKNLQKQNPIFAQSIQNIMVTEQQLGVGNINSAANSQASDEGKTSNKTGASQRKKLNPNSKSAPSSNSSSDSSAPDVPQDQQAAFLRLLTGQNPAFLQAPQMVSFLKQPKGALNGASVIVPGTIPSEASSLAIPTALASGVPAIPVIPALSDFSTAGLYPDAVKPATASVNLLGVSASLDAMTAATFPPPATESGVLTMTNAGPPAVWNPTLSSAAVLSDVTEKSVVNGEKNLMEQVNSLTQRPQRLAALVPSHSLPRGMIPIATTISSVANPLVAEPQTPTNGFLPAWFSQPAVIDSSQFSFPSSVVSAPTADNGLTSLINQNTLAQYLGDINTNLVNESLNQFVGNVNSFPSKQNSSPYKIYNTPTNLGNDGSKNSCSISCSGTSTTSNNNNNNSINNNNNNDNNHNNSSNNNSSNSNSCCSNNNNNNNISKNNNSNGNNNKNNNGSSSSSSNSSDSNNSISNSNTSSSNSNSHDIQSLNKKCKGEWNKKAVHSSPPLNNGLYRNSSTTSNSKLSDCPNGSDLESQSVDSPNPGHQPQSPVASHPSSLSASMWPAVANAIPHSLFSVNHTSSPRPIGFEARWLFPNSNLRSTPSSYISCPSNWASNLYTSPPTSNMTPLGQKRKYTRFLPSPEPSPEGNYIGQHSQGIGGHYLDTWPKRKKKN